MIAAWFEPLFGNSGCLDFLGLPFSTVIALRGTPVLGAHASSRAVVAKRPLVANVAGGDAYAQHLRSLLCEEVTKGYLSELKNNGYVASD